MPLKWFTCPDGGRTETADCLTKGGCRMKGRCATPAYLRMASSDRIWTGKPSTTQLIGGTMAAYLKITHNYAVSPDDRAFAIHGTKAHNNLEYFTDPDTLAEEKLDGDNVPETGIIDALIVEDGKSVLVDYKTSGSFKVAKALGFHVTVEDTGVLFKSGPRKGQPRTKKVLRQDNAMIDRWTWELQLSKYAYELERKGHKVDELRIMCVVRDGGTYIAKSRGAFRNVYYFPIRRLPGEIVLRYFKQKREALFQALEQGYWDKPCSTEENWQGKKCVSYCEVAEFCTLGKFLKEERKVLDMPPIKDLTDGSRNMPVIGSIRLGEKKISKAGKEYPSEIDYFRFDPRTPDDNKSAAIVQAVENKYGKEAKSIQIWLPLAEQDAVFDVWYRWYGSGTMQKCRGDGETARCAAKEPSEGLEILSEENNEIIVRCDGTECPHYGIGQCGRRAVLQVLMPDIPGAGVWKISTGSIVSIKNILDGMAYFTAVVGRFHMIPITLERRRTEIQQTDKKTGEKKKTIHYCLYMDTERTLAELQQIGQIDASKVMLQLPEATEDAEDIFNEPIPDDLDGYKSPLELPESEFAEVAEALGNVMGVDVITFGQFCTEKIAEDKIGQLRAALKGDGIARKDVQKMFNVWVDERIDDDAKLL